MTIKSAKIEIPHPTDHRQSTRAAQRRERRVVPETPRPKQDAEEPQFVLGYN